MLTTWDDHDFGQNDGGADYAEKEQAKADFLEAWPYVRSRLDPKQGGIYHSQTFGQGPPQNQIRVILLDTRYFRSPLKKAAIPTPLHRFEPTTDTNTTILGDEQWAWLENELKQSSRLTILVSSIQIIAQDHGFEKWANFPHERQKLFALIAKTKPRNLVLISGDRHIGSIAKTNIKNYGTVFELTASAINRASTLQEKDSSYLEMAFSGHNYGWLQLDSNKKKLALELRDSQGKTVQSASVPLK